MVAPSAFAAVFDRLDGLPLPVAARELARAGVAVFPCVPGEKTPIVASGFRRATTDPHQVAQWWRWQPSANIGIPTGAVSGLVVIDVDLHGTTSHDAFTHLTQEAAQWACGRERRCMVRAYDVPLPTTALRGCFALA